MFYFENFEDLTEYMFEKTDNDDNLVSVISDKETTIEIMRELLNYENVIIDSCELINDDDYDREYFVSLCDDEDSEYWYVNVKKAYCEENGKYLSTDGFVLFHEDTNSKAIIDMQNNEFIPLGEYDWFTISEDIEEDDDLTEEKSSYTVNGKIVDKKTFDNYVSKFAPDLVQSYDNEDETLDDEGYSISVKCNLDADDALKIIADMERRMMHMNDMFREMDNFRRLFNW